MIETDRSDSRSITSGAYPLDSKFWQSTWDYENRWDERRTVKQPNMLPTSSTYAGGDRRQFLNNELIFYGQRGSK